ncbi:MAG: DnaA/Hda family protein [Gemmatimonadota bacterium]
MTELDPKLTFEAFVVGPANRLASAAARRAAESPGKSYNPLFIYSASGLGKSHILGAVAHQARKANPKLAVEYQALEGYLEDLAGALESGRRDELRERYRALDILLVDDVQFLAGQAEAQEMLLSTLDALTASGSQIVLASDRPPAEINGLDARLVSRFSGGLIVDIAPPEYETRVAIIHKKTEERNQTLEPGVAEALGRYPFRNVRELGGALNRILAIQELEQRDVHPQEVPELMGEETPGVGEGGPPTDDFGSFLDEISSTLADTVRAQEQPWRRSLREAAEAAEQAGYSARRLRTLLEDSREPPNWRKRLEGFEADVVRLREIDRELDRLDNPWPEAAQGLLHDPEKLEEAEALLASVRERTRPFPVLVPGPDLDGLEGRVEPLALKASQQLVTAAKPQYNPLFFWSSDPGGPQALMAATGRTFRAAHPDEETAVVSVPEFAEDFIRALSAGVAGAWRERWWTVDLLLVHGAEKLSDTERAQDEFFHLFEALKRRGARVMIVSDRPPSRIGGIDERLRSRFEGGLVLEVSGATLPPGAEDLTLREPEEVVGGPGGTGGPAELELPALGETETADVVGTGVELRDAGPAASRSDAPPMGEPALVGTGATPSSSGGAEEPSREVPTPGRAEQGPGELRWLPTHEKVVWFWPQMQERLVEDLE